MKNWRHFTVVAVLAIIALTFTACPNDNGNNLQPKTYTVTFDADNGSPNTTQIITEGGKATKPTNPTKNGYGFAYWFNTTIDAEWDFNTPIIANISLKAKWNINQFTVTFDADNGTANTTQTITESGKATKPTNPTKDGYNFVYWFNTVTDAEWDFNTAITANITLKAKWNINQYTVTFNSNEGSTVSPITEVNHGSTIIAPTVPTKTGYYCIFIGWYDQSLINAFDFGTSITANITLYAKWRSFELGEIGPGGGKIFYRSENGFTMTDTNETCHYLEVAPSDMETMVAWASSAFENADITGTETAIGTGRKNTALILATDEEAPAAKACNDYNGGGKIDWFLPTDYELMELYRNRDVVGIEPSESPYGSSYWSSYQGVSSDASRFDFIEGRTWSSSKGVSYAYLARAVRAF